MFNNILCAIGVAVMGLTFSCNLASAGDSQTDTHYSHNQRVVHVSHDEWRYGDGSFAKGEPSDKTLFQYRASTGELVEVRSVKADAPADVATCTGKDCCQGGACCQKQSCSCGTQSCSTGPCRRLLGRLFHRCR